ncbi:MAG: hypothetical protein IPI00_04635 [Flavobacteriales bacterium]|nr:hypothetical protein [Flavobacteriales bacterium]MBK7239461.1 hypothetical protein [Flavobacteriales bacterium]MBK7296005.1 hypothetical protein [Flavobacteriales bacterium]MBK9535331.1 hypothetical protein [Flavobacteriales bacterium]MBP9137540.1 hypothetical protein [Flavobacteriales bacterium]
MASNKMAIRRLSPKDAEQLLMQYRSERRRLNFQLEKVRAAIAELKGSIVPREPGDVVIPVKRGPGRPRKDPSQLNSAKRSSGKRKKREIKDGGYRLSPWDHLVIDTITKADQLITKGRLLKAALVWAKKNEPGMTPKDVEDKLTRVLQKLSGKRQILGTHRTGMIRGYHYGIMNWFFASSGKLRKQHFERIDYNVESNE